MVHSVDIARHKTGEIISKGVLFCAATGAAAGPLNGGTTAEFNFSYEWFEGVKIGKVFVFRIGAGAIAGAAGGSTVEYAGGAGSGNDVLNGAFHGAIVGAAVAGTLTTIDALGGITITYGGTPPTSSGSNYDFGPTYTIFGAKTGQELTQNPIISSLAVSVASSYDVLTNGRLSDFILRKAGEKGGHGSCSGTFSESNCGIGPGTP